MKMCDQDNLLEQLDKSMQEYIDKVESRRFSPDSKQAFDLIKKLTKYDRYQKR